MSNHSVFSRCGQYRFAHWRSWEPQLPLLNFIGLNPSPADPGHEAVIKRYVQLAKRWGFGAISVANLFAYRCTSPLMLQRHPAPIGDNNNNWLESLHFDADVSVAAWGTHGQLGHRADWAVRSLHNLSCLDINVSGQPSHPLLTAATTTIKPLRQAIYFRQTEPSLQKRA
ncbi:DUF1643 domain-containing protein [Umboniibacter marinipuniceus]|uniref:DUF1643 domain-containing protein n=1 Tax=Umboniibacter marinipuniceus TaxID=569599 RepID=A0A3M0AK78_9GAMM|nr:DUF1643 domain-containing protein [Umboniibacter marinipuniceus]RMA79472.1 hypothetical protein DFR27_1913 [Umboniibacter marinipuniceus]